MRSTFERLSRIFGAVDGPANVAVVSGVAGACLSTGILIVLGLANLVADGFSMAVIFLRPGLTRI